MLTREPFPGLTNVRAAGNGSLMRLAPVPMFYAADPAQSVHLSGESSRTTHALPVVVDACRFFGGLILGALISAPREALLAERYSPIPGYWEEHPLAGEITGSRRVPISIKTHRRSGGAGMSSTRLKRHSGLFPGAAPSRKAASWQ